MVNVITGFVVTTTYAAPMWRYPTPCIRIVSRSVLHTPVCCLPALTFTPLLLIRTARAEQHAFAQRHENFVEVASTLTL